MIFLHISIMQRKPLEPLQSDVGSLMTLFRLFGADSEPKISIPLFKFKTAAEAFQWIGFGGAPVDDSRGNKLAKYPVQAMNGDHPTGFLHWGAKLETRKHCFFEIGNYDKIVRFDFRVNYSEVNNNPFIQLDELTIENGNDILSVNCADDYYLGFIANLSAVISETVVYLNRDETDMAKASFAKLKPFVDQLYEWERQADMQLAQERAEMRLG